MIDDHRILSLTHIRRQRERLKKIGNHTSHIDNTHTHTIYTIYTIPQTPLNRSFVVFFKILVSPLRERERERDFQIS